MDFSCIIVNILNQISYYLDHDETENKITVLS